MCSVARRQNNLRISSATVSRQANKFMKTQSVSSKYKVEKNTEITRVESSAGNLDLINRTFIMERDGSMPATGFNAWAGNRISSAAKGRHGATDYEPMLATSRVGGSRPASSRPAQLQSRNESHFTTRLASPHGRQQPEVKIYKNGLNEAILSYEKRFKV